MTVKLRHVGIVVQDMNKMIEYYRNKMGLRVESDKVEKVRIVKFETGIELLEYESMSEHTLRQKGISHIAFTTDPENNFIELVEEKDGRNE